MLKIKDNINLDVLVDKYGFNYCNDSEEYGEYYYYHSWDETWCIYVMVKNRQVSLTSTYPLSDCDILEVLYDLVDDGRVEKI